MFEDAWRDAEPWIAALRAGLLRPERRTLDAARAVVADITSPRDAWNALVSAGLCPRSWLAHPSRCFRIASNLFLPSPPDAFSEHPASVDACVAFASDVSGVLVAEELAYEINRRMVPWGVLPCTRVAWQVLEKGWRRLPRNPAPGTVDRIHFVSGSPRAFAASELVDANHQRVDAMSVMQIDREALPPCGDGYPR